MATIYKRKQDQGKKRASWYIGYTNHLGRRRTVKGFTDRGETERFAVQLEDEARLIREGLKEPVREQLRTARQVAIENHIQSFKKHLESRDITEKQVSETISRVQKFVADVQMKTLADFNATAVETFLTNLRGLGRSKQTANNYLMAIKQFAGWLVRTKRLAENPTSLIRRFNAQTDRRHDRRPLSADELTWLVSAADIGPVVESIPGSDRSVMYVLATWTGFRKGEIGSLTSQSFDFESDPPTVTVTANFSKRKRKDTQVLHLDVAKHLKTWLEKQNKTSSTTLLFPVSGKVPGGTERKTNKMMKRDLESARELWLAAIKKDETLSDDERAKLEATDFLKYEDSRGEFADFHANRHTFITNLGKAGVSPKTAQELARHSDVRLTIGVYSHSDLAEKADAVRRLPSPEWLNANGSTSKLEVSDNGNATHTKGAQRIGSAPKSQAGTNGQSPSQPAAKEGSDGVDDSSTEVPMRSDVDAACQSMASQKESTPRWARTSNLRFRRPILYLCERI